MSLTLTEHRSHRTRPTHPSGLSRRLWHALAVALLGLLACLSVPAVRAEAPTLSSFEVTRDEEGLQLSFAVRFELPAVVQDALERGIPLNFVAEARVLRDRWYWSDKRVARATRVWRLAYQPLTRKYRVSFGGLNQTFENLTDALAAVRRANSWKVAELRDIDEGARHTIEFSYQLDTSLLPRPMQIGIGGQPEWTLFVERFQRIN